MVKPGFNKPRKWHPDLLGTTDSFVPSGKPIPEKLIRAHFGVKEETDERDARRASGREESQDA